MNICVCGWYGREYDEFYMTLYKANKKHPVTVIAKRKSNYWYEMALPFEIIENIGLEWGAYDYYLRHIWQGGDTLFTHDDVIFGHIVKDNKVVRQELIFDAFAQIDADQAYIFSNRAEDVFNNGNHGRALFVSDRLMEWLKPQGIWFDDDNKGDTTKGNYNRGTEEFKLKMIEAQQQGFNTLKKVYAPAFMAAHRGKSVNWEDLL